MELELNHISVSVEGDYYQVLFEDRGDTGEDLDPDSKYFLIQRQFEIPDDDKVYLECHKFEYSGHFDFLTAELYSNKLVLKTAKKKHPDFTVRFSLESLKNTNLFKTLKTMIPNMKRRK